MAAVDVAGVTRRQRTTDVVALSAPRCRTSRHDVLREDQYGSSEEMIARSMLPARMKRRVRCACL